MHRSLLVPCTRSEGKEQQMTQKIAPEEKHLRKEDFQLAMRSTRDGLWDWNLRTDEVYFSPRWKIMFGYREDELEPHFDTWNKLIHPDDQGQTLALLQNLIEGRSERLHAEFRMRHRDGRYLDIVSLAFPDRDASGRVVRLVGTHADVTDSRRAERILKEREALLDKTSRMAKVGGWGFDVATGIGTWTDEVARIHGLDLDAVTNSEIGLSFYQGDHLVAIQQALKEAIDNARPYDLELELITAQGIRKWIRTVGQPVLREGRVVRIEGIFQDISERKEAEAKIQALNAELELRVEQRTAELVAANAELESFTYAVSHDLRAPLRAMSGFSQALIEDYGNSLAGEARLYLDQIIIGSRRMGELIDGLLTLSRSTRAELHRDRVDLSSMAEQLLRALATAEPERVVSWEVAPDLVTRGDTIMLEVVMSNLLANAWKYTSRRDKAIIRVFSRKVGAQHFFCITDNGAGFDAAHAAKLFQPFQRLHRQEEFPGIGIGLATVQRILHRHGGTIEAEGQRDQGATFCFNLPGHGEKMKEP